MKSNMTNKTNETQEESDSDWDSMSEMRPPPSPLQAASGGDRHDVNNGENHTDDLSEKQEYPPHSFRSEVKHHPASGRLPPVKLPGKENKGNMYDPSPMRNHKNDQRLPFHINSPKNVEKGESVSPQNHLQDKDRQKFVKQTGHIRPQDQILASLSRFKNLPSNANNLKKATHQGIDNEGYKDDGNENVPYKSMSNYGDEFQMSIEEDKTQQMQRSSSFAENSPNFNERGVILPVKISSQDLESTSQYSLVQTSLKEINNVFEKSFGILSLPFFCIISFCHHAIKFMLVVIIKPVFLDSLMLLSKFFFSPLLREVLQPTFFFLKTIADVLAEILVSFFMPFAKLLKAFRLVEINIYDKKETLKV